jgi:pyruvate/2-oxoglutarate dehydrogenase complex dihydrolipoamide dehydrogenase (E3) component
LLVSPGVPRITASLRDPARLPRGLLKVVVEAGTEKILGAVVLGYEGGEVMTVIQAAMMGGLKCTALRDAVFRPPNSG